jgi:hypothetical protein
MGAEHGLATSVSDPKSGPARRVRGRLSGFVTGSLGTVSGLAPHVLHHVGLLAGVALVTGLGGTIVFGLVGLAASVPFLLRLHRRFGTWRAPAIALVVFAAMFAVSAFVIGPLISGSSSPPSPTPTGHQGHH